MGAEAEVGVLTEESPSPVVAICQALQPLGASWRAEIGQPVGPGWIAGTDLQDASAGPFNALLQRIGARAQTDDRLTIAASFAVRYGWASGMAIAPYLRFDCVPDVSLDNVSFKFRDSTFLECTAISDARGCMISTAPGAQHPAIVPVDSHHALLRMLRATLVGQAAPVVEALHRWAGFSRRGTWGMLTSAWVTHFTGLFAGRDQRLLLPAIEQLCAGDDLAAMMQPRLHAVTYRDVTHLYQRRASCCRWYLLPQGDLCTSCPLVPHEERLRRNVAWMQKQVDQPPDRRGHT